MKTRLNKRKINMSSLSAGRGSRGNKALYTAGSSGSADAAPRMTEDGRSMVEMLGVLAVMGVLSVGGVAMYTSAMNKHKANELLNEASKRAVVVATQAMMGKTGDIPLSEFSINTFSGVNFGQTAKVANNQITLTLSGDGLSNVCPQMIAATGDNSVMLIEEGCGKITFNTDMSKGVKAVGVATPDGYTNDDGSDCSGDTKLGTECQVCVNGSYVDSDAKCGTDQICVDGICQSISEIPSCLCMTTTTGSLKYCGGVAREYCNNNDSCSAKGYGTYDDTTKSCTDATEIQDRCLKNSDCETIEGCSNASCFCEYNGLVNCEKGPLGAVGKCVSKTEKRENFPSDSKAEEEGYIKSKNLDWFSAQNFCHAWNKNLVSLSTFGLSVPNNSNTCNGEECGITINDWNTFYNKFGRGHFWTKDLYTSCNDFVISTVFSPPIVTGTGIFNSSKRDFSSGPAALCH